MVNADLRRAESRGDSSLPDVRWSRRYSRQGRITAVRRITGLLQRALHVLRVYQAFPVDLVLDSR